MLSLRHVEKYILPRQVVTRQRPRAAWAVAEAGLLLSGHVQAQSSEAPLSLAINRVSEAVGGTLNISTDNLRKEAKARKT